MLSSNKKTSFNYLLGITLASAIITLSGCGGDSSKAAPDTSNVTDAKLKQSLKKGLTNGFKSNVNTFGSTVSTVKGSFQDSATPKHLANVMTGVTASTDFVDELNDGTGEMVDKFNSIIDNSSHTNTGNVYTFTPNPVTVCNDLANSPSAQADCQTFMAHITFVSTIHTIDSNNNVTAADTVFKYDTSTFSEMGFTGNSSFYEVKFGGMTALLNGLNAVLDPSDQIDIPTAMAGSLKIASTAQTATAGTLTLSVPTAISITNNSPAAAVNIGQTASLFSVTANSTANTMDLNVNLNALDILTTNDDNANDLYPQQLLISALSGQALVSNNGNTVTLTGITATGIELKLDSTQALAASLTPLNATLTSTGTQKIATLGSALNFDLALSNVRNFLDDNDPTTHTAAFTFDAPIGTATQAVSGNGDLVKVTTGSITAVTSSTSNATNTANVSANQCLNTEDLSLDTSANCQ